MSAKILVFCDHNLIELLQPLLSSRGYYTDATSSETEAISRLQTIHYDLLVLSLWLPNRKAMADFLTEWRLRSPNQNYPLVLVLESKTDSFCGIIRAPLYPHQAHGYMPFPAPAEDFPEWIEPLLGGLSTQKMPGDEGFSRYEYPAWDIAFEYPSLWREGHTVTFWGASHRSLKAGAQIKVYKYSPISAAFNNATRGKRAFLSKFFTKTMPFLPLGAGIADKHLTHNPQSPHLTKEIIDNSFGRFRKLRQITSERQIQIAGLQATEVEYLWKTEFAGFYSGRQIIAIVSKKATYGITLEAAEDDFDDYRPVYSHLVETFEFLS